MGAEQFTNMLGAVYEFKEPFSNFVVSEEIMIPKPSDSPANNRIRRGIY